MRQIVDVGQDHPVAARIEHLLDVDAGGGGNPRVVDQAERAPEQDQGVHRLAIERAMLEIEADAVVAVLVREFHRDRARGQQPQHVQGLHLARSAGFLRRHRNVLVAR